MCDYLAYCLDDPETNSVILFVEGFKRPERFLALADRALELGKPIMAVKVGRSDQAQAAAMAHSGSLAGEARVTDAALDAAGVIRCRDLDELLETAELVEGVRRTGRRVGRGRTGVVTVSTGEASLIADLVPRTGLDLPPRPGLRARRASSRRCRRWATSATRSTRGARPTPATAYGAAFEAMAASGAYDVLVLVHDFPYRSLASEVATANEVTGALLAATRRPPRHPAGLRVADLRRAAARDEGAPRRGRSAAHRSCAAPSRGVPGDRRGRPLGGDATSVAGTTGHGGPAGRGWPRAGRSYGADPSPTRRPRRPPVALSERESLALVSAAGIPVTEVDGRDRRARPRSPRRAGSGDRSRSSSTPSGWPTRARSAGWRSGCAATTRSTAPP